MNDEWHKALVLVMRKLGVVEILITQADMESIQAITEAEKVPCAITFEEVDGVHIRLSTAGEVKQLGGYQQLDG